MMSKKYGAVSPKTSRSGSISLADALDGHQRLADEHEVGRDLEAVLDRPLHEVADHRRELDLLERLAEVLLGEHRDLGAVLAHVDLLRRAADGVERVGDADCPFARRRPSGRSCGRGARARGGPTMPTSISPTIGASFGPMMMTLPGCGSAWKKPSSKIILTMIADRQLGDRLAARPRSATARSSFLPSKNSSVSTCLLEACL